MTDEPGRVPLREYIEAVLDEQRRGMVVAEQEREKAARALRTELSRAIDEGDDRLREHIDQQFNQIAAALVSAEKLEIERINKVSADIKAVAAEIRIAAEASEKAIAKADAANEKRFEGMNEWRGQSADRERSQEEQMAALAGTFLPREVAEAQFTEMRRALATLTEKINRLV